MDRFRASGSCEWLAPERPGLGERAPGARGIAKAWRPCASEPAASNSGAVDEALPAAMDSKLVDDSFARREVVQVAERSLQPRQRRKISPGLGRRKERRENFG